MIRLTWLAVAVVRLEPAWNTHTELGSPWPSRVKAPVKPRLVAEL